MVHLNTSVTNIQIIQKARPGTVKDVNELKEELVILWVFHGMGVLCIPWRWCGGAPWHHQPPVPGVGQQTQRTLLICILNMYEYVYWSVLQWIALYNIKPNINNTNLSHITYMCIRHTVTHFQRFPAISRRREELPNGVVASEVDLACGKEVHGHAPCCSREQHHRLSKKHPGTGEHHCTIAPLATTWDHWVILSAGHHLGHSRAPLGILTSLKMSEVWNAMSESAVRHV